MEPLGFAVGGELPLRVYNNIINSRIVLMASITRGEVYIQVWEAIWCSEFMVCYN